MSITITIGMTPFMTAAPILAAMTRQCLAMTMVMVPTLQGLRLGMTALATKLEWHRVQSGLRAATRTEGIGSPARYIECMEFFLAPYPVHGTPNDGDPSKAPDLTNNSWGCIPQDGCSPSTLQAAVDAQVAAGIMMVVAAGNDGPNCSTVMYPPCIYEAAYTVGALFTGADTIAPFSSRGPVIVDQSNRMKPNITAPGTQTRSSVNTSDDAYATRSGTSMATPHVAGAIALLWSARAELQNDISSTRAVLDRAAVHILEGVCDGGPPVTPNNTYGKGRLDILAAVKARAIPTPRERSTPAPRPSP